jgi:hypothetical protein
MNLHEPKKTGKYQAETGDNRQFIRAKKNRELRNTDQKMDGNNQAV